MERVELISCKSRVSLRNVLSLLFWKSAVSLDGQNKCFKTRWYLSIVLFLDFFPRTLPKRQRGYTKTLFLSKTNAFNSWKLVILCGLEWGVAEMINVPIFQGTFCYCWHCRVHLLLFTKIGRKKEKDFYFSICLVQAYQSLAHED